MNNPSSIRYHGLDALRAFAMLLGIALHGGMSYIGDYAGDASWPFDPSSSFVLVVMVAWIHSWRMQAFFIMAGFFAHLVIARRGLRSFVDNRFRRIFIPFVAGIFIVVPLTIAAFAYGIWYTGADSGLDGKTDIPLAHLWFLYYLLGFYALTVLICWGVSRTHIRVEPFLHRMDRLIRAVMESRWRVVWLALPTMLLLALVETEDVGMFYANLRFFLYQSLFFVFGWFLYRQPALLSVLRSRRVWLSYLLIGTLVAMPLWFVLSDSPHSLLYTGAYSLQTWLIALGLIGMCDALNAKPRPWVVYLTDAAYWVYLIHLPLVVLFNVWLMGLPWAALPKFFVVCSLCTLILLATYHWGVRYTFIGTMLNGPRQRRTVNT